MICAAWMCTELFAASAKITKCPEPAQCNFLEVPFSAKITKSTIENTDATALDPLTNRRQCRETKRRSRPVMANGT